MQVIVRHEGREIHRGELLREGATCTEVQTVYPDGSKGALTWRNCDITIDPV